MSDVQNTFNDAFRMRIYRRFKRREHYFDKLHRSGVISGERKSNWLGISKSLHSERKKNIIEAKRPFYKRPGRKRTAQQTGPSIICRRDGCEKPAARNRVYCSKDCAPFASLLKSRSK